MILFTNIDIDDSRIPAQECIPDHVKVVTMCSQKNQLIIGSQNPNEQHGFIKKTIRIGVLNLEL